MSIFAKLTGERRSELLRNLQELSHYTGQRRFQEDMPVVQQEFSGPGIPGAPVGPGAPRGQAPPGGYSVLAARSLPDTESIQEDCQYPRVGPDDMLPGLVSGNVALGGSEDEEPEDVAVIIPVSMRLQNLHNFPASTMANKTNSRSQMMAMHRAKFGCVTSAAKSLDLLRQNLQKKINKDIDELIQSYLDKYFNPCIENIKKNNGDESVSEEHVHTVCRQILEEAKRLYSSPTRGSTPYPDVSDSESISELRMSRIVNKNIPSYLKRSHASDTDSDVSISVTRHKRARGLGSGRSTPSSKVNKGEPILREGPKWDPERLTLETKFVMGAKANKALGLGATRGRLYIKHPDLFKYSGDSDDKVWLYENRLMPATGGRAYLLIEEDIYDLAESNEYKNQPGLMLNILKGFAVPEFMLLKMKLHMEALRTDRNKFRQGQVISDKLDAIKSDLGETYEEANSETGKGDIASSGPTSPVTMETCSTHNPSPLGEFADLEVPSPTVMSDLGLTDGQLSAPFDVHE